MTEVKMMSQVVSPATKTALSQEQIDQISGGRWVSTRTFSPIDANGEGGVTIYDIDSAWVN